ncbi:hypothetical protein [Blastomonas sp.]|uniref:hypothetical protein n=1 Tax=Blastomonas sp. TaxID=1909299 RepID=UPI003593F117
MRISISTVLDAPFAKVREELGKSRLLVHVTAPLVKFRPITPPSFPSEWRDGRYLVAMLLGGVLPLGRQWIEISHPKPESSSVYRIRDNGSGQLVRTWDHHITIHERPDGRTDYLDEVEIKAGLLTPIIASFAALFYRHRQRRWRFLARSEFRYS